MGPDAEDVLQTTGTVSQQRSKLPTPLSSRSSTTISGFVRISIIYERARFNTRKQQPGKSGEQYILALYTLITNCEYTGERKEQAIRVRLVVGICDVTLSKQLHIDLGEGKEAGLPKRSSK